MAQAEIAASVPYGAHEGMTQAACPDEKLLSNKWCGDIPSTVNTCQPRGGFIAQYQWGDKYYTCSREVICSPGEYLADDCTCALLIKDCYHEAQNCRVPKLTKLGSGTCTEKDWKANEPQFCSIGSPGEGCNPIGVMRELAYVVDSTGKSRWITDLNIEEALIYDKSESFIQDKHVSLSGPVRGNSAYCDHFKDLPNCYASIASENSPYRIFRSNGAIPHIHLDTCSSPVYCYGYKTTLVYTHKTTELKSSCSGCVVSCHNTGVHIVTNLEGKSHIQVCGRAECQMLDTNSKILDLPRSFHSRTTDERIRVTIHSEDRLVSYDNFTACPVVPVCEAIDCTFCSDHLLNPTCYSKLDWVLTLVFLYVLMVLTGLALTCAIPIFRVLWNLVSFMIKLFWKMTKMMLRMSGRAAGRAKQFADDDSIELRPASIVREPLINSRPARQNKAGIRLPAGLVIIMILLPLVVCKAPCSSVVVDTVMTESCTLKGDSYHCSISSINEVPLISYDQTTCLMYLTPGGQTLGQLQITPLDISFKCSKQALYHTRDFEMLSDHVVRCPRSGPCTEDWCHSVTTDTDVPDLPKISYPSHQSCKLGEACWGNGCFFCTSSCHVIRYYARPKTDTIYELYSCPKWDPSGSFHFLWESTSGNTETTISLIHGETKSISSDMSVTLDVNIQSKLPILSKTFISDGRRVALSDSSFAGQPVAGQLGQVQCHSAEKASKLQSCTMAPNICVCRPEQSDDGCDCSQVFIDRIFSSSAVLPVNVENHHIEMNRDTPYLKTPAFGSGHIKVRSSMKLIGTAVPAESCSVNLIKISGCYSCVSGARLSYSCSTEKHHTVVASCYGDIHLILECDNSGVEREVRFQSPTPLITLQCTTACSKMGFSLSGTLVRMAQPDLSGQGHINLVPGAAKEGAIEWLRQCWSLLGWFNMFWLVGMVSMVVLVLYFCQRRASPTHIVKYIKSS